MLYMVTMLVFKMKYHPLNFMKSQVNGSLIPNFSSFINEMCMRDYTNNFTIDEIFLIRDDLIQWVREISFHLDFIVLIPRFDKVNGQHEIKTYVLLGCEMDGKYKKYKPDVQPSMSDTRKYDSSFKLRGKPISNGEEWILKVMCEYHNCCLSKTLVGHPYVGWLKPSEHSFFVNITKSQVKLANILLTLK